VAPTDYAVAADRIMVDRDFLVRVDSYCSLVAYRRDLAPEVIENLKRLSSEARTLYEGKR
jgi:hypothetical protein